MPDLDLVRLIDIQVPLSQRIRLEAMYCAVSFESIEGTGIKSRVTVQKAVTTYWRSAASAWSMRSRP